MYVRDLLLVNEAGLNVDDVAVGFADFSHALNLVLGFDVAPILEHNVRPAVVANTACEAAHAPAPAGNDFSAAQRIDAIMFWWRCCGTSSLIPRRNLSFDTPHEYSIPSPAISGCYFRRHQQDVSTALHLVLERCFFVTKIWQPAEKFS